MRSAAAVRTFPSRLERFRRDVRPTPALPLAVGVATARRVEVAYETSEHRLVYLDLLASDHVAGKTAECTPTNGFSAFPMVVSHSAQSDERVVLVW